jgi:hypothetical protein
MSKITYRQEPICVSSSMQRKRVQAKEHRNMLTHDPVSASKHNHNERLHRATEQTTKMWAEAYQQCTNLPAATKRIPQDLGPQEGGMLPSFERHTGNTQAKARTVW